MRNGHSDANIDTVISLAAGLGVSQDVTVPRAVVSSLENTNKQLVLPHFTNIKQYPSQYGISSDCCAVYFAPTRVVLPVAGFFCCRIELLFLCILPTDLLWEVVQVPMFVHSFSK